MPGRGKNQAPKEEEQQVPKEELQQVIVEPQQVVLDHVQFQMHWDPDLIDSIHEHHIQVVFPQQHVEEDQKQSFIFHCDHCQDGFTREKDYMDHIIKAEEAGHGVVTCFRCNLIFQTLQLKRDHMAAVHFNDRQLLCEVCNEVSPTINDLIDHHQEHEKGLRIEVTEPISVNYQCHLCPDVFAREEELKKHVIEHKPHACNVCKRVRYQTKQELDNHMRVHDDTLKNVCKFCEKSFANQKNRRVHEKFVHNFQENKPLNCAVCWKIVLNRKQLQEHCRSEHPGLGTITTFHEAAPAQKESSELKPKKIKLSKD